MQSCRVHCFAAVCRAKTDKWSLRADRKEVEGLLCSEGTRNSLDCEALGRGRPNPQRKPTQVSGDRAPWSAHCEIHLNGQRKRRAERRRRRGRHAAATPSAIKNTPLQPQGCCPIFCLLFRWWRSWRPGYSWRMRIRFPREAAARVFYN